MSIYIIEFDIYSIHERKKLKDDVKMNFVYYIYNILNSVKYSSIVIDVNSIYT